MEKLDLEGFNRILSTLENKRRMDRRDAILWMFHTFDLSAIQDYAESMYRTPQIVSTDSDLESINEYVRRMNLK